jgi:HK97 gp10 family phage protein
MNEINIKIEGIDKLTRAMTKAPVETLNQISIAVRKAALTIQSAALREAPVNKGSGGGNLRQNIRTHLISKTRAEIVSNAPYSRYVEEGTGPHIIKVRNKKVLANRRTGEFFGKTVKHPGTRPNPFMLRAATKSIGRINEFFAIAIRNVINTIK